MSIALLFAFACLFILFMNLGAKKFDRYLLPVYPMLDLAAGLGIVAIVGWIVRRRQPRTVQLVVAVAVVGALCIQGALVLPHYPYYLTYYNPLLGGGRAAPTVMQIGRGEGAELAAQALNRLPTTTPTTTAASAFPMDPFPTSLSAAPCHPPFGRWLIMLCFTHRMFSGRCRRRARWPGWRG
ncbi:MAG: hypothetical protein R2867_02175 [Caldilineaceae bacterium]